MTEQEIGGGGYHDEVVVVEEIHQPYVDEVVVETYDDGGYDGGYDSD